MLDTKAERFEDLLGEVREQLVKDGQNQARVQRSGFYVACNRYTGLMCVYVCGCVRARARARVCMSVCARARESVTESGSHPSDYNSNSKHWFTTSFLGGRCRKAVLGV